MICLHISPFTKQRGKMDRERTFISKKFASRGATGQTSSKNSGKTLQFAIIHDVTQILKDWSEGSEDAWAQSQQPIRFSSAVTMQLSQSWEINTRAASKHTSEWPNFPTTGASPTRRGYSNSRWPECSAATHQLPSP